MSTSESKKTLLHFILINDLTYREQMVDMFQKVMIEEYTEGILEGIKIATSERFKKYP